jgi:hypothetical protein
MIKKPLVLLIALSTGFLISSCNFPYQPKQFVIPPPNYIFPSKTEMLNFIGNGGIHVKLAFTIKNSARDVYYIDYNDYNDSAFIPRKLKKPAGKENFHADSPLISPDGSFVAYYLTAGATVNGAYIQRLDTSSSPVLIDANGTEPHWWQDNTGGIYIIYSNIIFTQLGGLNQGVGQTFKRKVDLTGDGAITGPAQVLAPYPMNGGLSPDGNYLCTGYANAAFYGLFDASLIPINQNNQTCNPSTDPDTVHRGRMMFLNFSGIQNMSNTFIGNADFPDSFVLEHTVLYIVDYTNTVRDYVTLGQLNAAYGGYIEWQDPEWSNNPQFAAALGVIDDAQADGIIIKNVGDPASKKAFLKFTLGKGKLDVTSTPYIWIGK